ncbi:hypothetical protein BC830DRAFT_1113315 [Chytriomyces sp. MP71]|nr:hypothetical protein BC830DRAFT_1113315 [Chytriomyces sp. MP71]
MQEHPFPGQCVSKDAHRIKSCDFCRLKNRKCDRTEYCLRCRNKGIPCIYSKNSTSSKAYRELKKKLKYGEVGMSRQSEGARSTSSPNPPATTSAADRMAPKSARQHPLPPQATHILPSSIPLPHAKVSLAQASSAGPSATFLMAPSRFLSSPTLNASHAQRLPHVQHIHYPTYHSVNSSGQDLTRQLSMQSDTSHGSNMTTSSAYTSPHSCYEQLHSQHSVQQPLHYSLPPQTHPPLTTTVEAKKSDNPLSALAEVCVTELKLPSFSFLMQQIERQRTTF